MDRPEAFGQHINAEIASDIAESSGLVDCILSLQPKEGSIGGAMSRDETVLARVDELDGQIGYSFELEKIHAIFKTDTPLNVVLNQECER